MPADDRVRMMGGVTEQEIQTAVDDIADLLGKGVSLDDLTGRLLAYSAQHGHADDARVRALLNREVPADILAWEASHGTATAVHPVVVKANPDLGMLARICVPLIHRGVRTGLVYILEPDHEPTAEEVVQQITGIHDQLALLATVLYEAATPHLDERRQRELAFFGACQGEPASIDAVKSWTAVRAARRYRIAVSIFTADGTVTTFAEARAAQLRLATQQTVSRYPGAIASSVQETHAIVLLRPDKEPNPALRIHQRLATASGIRAEGDGEERLYTGVAQDVTTVEQFPTAYHQAVIAAQTAAVEPESGTLATWDNIGPYRLIATRLRTDAGPISPLLDALTAADPSGDLRETLEVFYDRGDSVQAVADTLHLHRTSLYYRLNRIRDIIKADPLNGAVRLELHLALKATRWLRRPQI